MLPRENEPLTIAAAKARLVAPLTLATVNCIRHVSHSLLRTDTGRLSTHGVEEGQGSDNCVDQVDTGQDARGMSLGVKERHQGTSNNAI